MRQERGGEGGQNPTSGYPSTATIQVHYRLYTVRILFRAGQSALGFHRPSWRGQSGQSLECPLFNASRSKAGGALTTLDIIMTTIVCAKLHNNGKKHAQTPSLSLKKKKQTPTLTSLTSGPSAVRASPRAAKPLISMEPLHGNPDAELIAAPMLTPAARATR